MKPIPFCDLHRANATIRDDIDRAIAGCIDRSSFLRGLQTEAFEEEWAAYCGQSYAVCCNSGTDALTLAATALDMNFAIIPANTLPLTGIGLHRGGAKVRVAEINGDGWMAEHAPEAVPVLLFGRLPESQSTPALLYDAAHAHGWKPPVGAVAAWSFYPTKTLGALGDAGTVTTNDAALAAAMRDLCGRDDKLHHRHQITSRIDEIQASVLRVKLKHLNSWLAQRSFIGAHYERRFSALGITLRGPSLHHLYVIRVSNRDGLVRYLDQRCIHSKLHWSNPLHKAPGPWIRQGDYLEAEQWCNSILSLPCYPGLQADEVDRVCDAVEEYCALERKGSGHY